MSIFMRPRSLICVASLLALLFAQPPTIAAVKVVEDAEGQDGLTVFQMTVTPAAEPVPALKHRLTLRPHERKPGNAATRYLRSVWEHSLDGRWKWTRDKFGPETFDSWYGRTLAIDDLPLEDVRKAAGGFVSYVEDHIDPASRCRECEWGLGEEDLRGIDTINFLLPDAQGSRRISRLLALLTRLTIAERRYGDAVEYMRMNYQLGQDIGKQLFLVSNLVGLATVRRTNHTMIDLIAAPNSPNMYWALSELPRPIVDMRTAMRLEMSLGPRIVPALLDVESAEHSSDEWARLLVEGIASSQELVTYPDIPWPAEGPFSESELAATGLTLVSYPAAKDRLIQSGMDRELVEAMAVGQVMLVDAAREWRRIADEYEKWWYVGFSQAREPLREVDKVFRGSRLEGGFGRMLARALLPAIRAARNAEMRTQWQMGALRVVEAIRMHAAEASMLPRTLDEIKVVPVPLNPITLKPYQYRLDGQTAVLDLPFSDGMPSVAWRFEITLAE